MEILKLLQERHTTKKYDASRKISDADFDLLLESLRLAPSSVNSQPWEFFIADTKEAKEKLLPAIADFNHSRVTDSDRLIVCAIHTDLDETYMQDLDDQEEADGRYQDPAYKVDNGQRRRFFVGKYRDAGEIACWAGKQAYIAQGFLLYTAAALGIHSTPIEGWDADKVDEILGPVRRSARIRSCRRPQCCSPEVTLAGSAHLPQTLTLSAQALSDLTLGARQGSSRHAYS